MKFSLKEGLKMLILAPSAASLAYILTDIMYSLSVTSGALPSGMQYALIVGAVTFATVVVAGLDKVILED